MSNAGRGTSLVRANSRDQNTCAVPSDTHPAGCKDATAGSQTNTNTATTTGNSGANAAEQSRCPATDIEDDVNEYG